MSSQDPLDPCIPNNCGFYYLEQIASVPKSSFAFGGGNNLTTALGILDQVIFADCVEVPERTPRTTQPAPPPAPPHPSNPLPRPQVEFVCKVSAHCNLPVIVEVHGHALDAGGQPTPPRTLHAPARSSASHMHPHARTAAPPPTTRTRP
jgi:hypothetical protein